jgi:hypothetical protein
MSRLKTHYRPKKFASGGAVEAEPPATPPPKVSISLDVPVNDVDPSAALQGQISALRNAEEITKVRGYIASHPDMMQNPNLLVLAANEVEREGHDLPLHSEAFFHKVRENFEGRMRRLNEPDDLAPSTEPTPAFFEVREPKSPNRASMFSAPVSRSVPGSSPEAGEIASGRGSTRVTLSAQEKEIARASGISELDYALGKLELQKRKAEGHYER